MYKVIKNYCENEKTNGLFLMDLPTGFGKTHDVIQYIFDAVCDEKNKDKKFFFVTNLKKNLPEEKLRKLFEKNGRKEEFEQKFLYLNSNAELVIEGYKNSQKRTDRRPLKFRIPKDILEWEETQFFLQDLQDILIQRENKSNGEFANSSSLENTFATKIERDFRHKVEMQLRSEFKKLEDRKKAILQDERWCWLGELYESTKTSDKQIIFLSAKKFVTKNDTLVEAPYFFYTNKIMENAVVFIDEFDAAKSDFLDNIIEDGIRDKIDFIDLFIDIRAILQVKAFQKDLRRKSKWYQEKKYGWKPVESIIKGFRENADEIFERFHLSCDIRTNRDQDLSKNFLFQDSQYHTIANDSKFISVTHDPDEERNEIQISNECAADNSYSIQTMLSKVRGFVNFFQIGVWRLAYNLFSYRNENHIGDGEFSFEAAVNTVLKQFRLKDRHISYLKTQILQDVRKRGNENMAKDFDLKFFARGLRYYAFIDDVSNDLQSVVMMYAFNNTPEKILLNTCERAKVVGISATATIPSAIGNFNLSYLEEQLGDCFQRISVEDRNRLRAKFKSQQKGYDDKVKIHAELLGKEVRGCYDEKAWLNLFGEEEVALEAHGMVCNSVPDDDNGFHKERYYRIVQAYKKFYDNKGIHSFLCILTTHPKEYVCRGLNRKTLIDLFKFIDKNAEEKVCWLKTEGFDEEKKKISDALEKGGKRFVISAYQTIGAGQNLQYKIPSRLSRSLITVNDSREDDDKDYDAIYLDNPTNLLVNVNVDKLGQKDFVRFLFQMEYLQSNGEVSSDLAMKHVRKGFEAHSTQHKPIPRKGVEGVTNRLSVVLYATRSIIQAIGRMCRTNHKSSNIYVYADSRIAENIDRNVANNLILNREFETLLKEIDTNQTRAIIRPQLELKAEEKSIAVNGFISTMLKDSWSDIKIERWKFLRDFVLKHPTISKAELNRSGMNSFYTDLPRKMNVLYYNQEYDYRKVHVSFAPNRDFPCVESATECRLDKLMSWGGFRRFFEEHDYATAFEPNDCIMVPTLYNNIYKGALGEVIGHFIFSKMFNVELEEITDYTAFELFDFKVPDKPYYVDFKHWNVSSDIERDAMRAKISEKARKCGCEKALVVNILAERFFDCHKYDDGVEILAVPSLFFANDMQKNKDAIDRIRRFIG